SADDPDRLSNDASSYRRRAGRYATPRPASSARESAPSFLNTHGRSAQSPLSGARLYRGCDSRNVPLDCRRSRWSVYQLSGSPTAPAGYHVPASVKTTALLLPGGLLFDLRNDVLTKQLNRRHHLLV